MSNDVNSGTSTNSGTNSGCGTSVVPSEFTIMDEADSQQIQRAESAIKQALAYEVRGKKQLSYMGIKWLVLKMSQKEQPLEIVDMPIVELSKINPEDQSTWIWYCTIKARNLKTGLVTIGASESAYLAKSPSGFNSYDTFGRTKAISKAERNAYRKQIPEIEINAMLGSIVPSDIEHLKSNNSDTTTVPNNTPTPPSQKQLDYLKSLGYTGITPKTSAEASDKISQLKNNFSSDKYCTCASPIPNSVTNNKTCQTCLKLLKVPS